MSTHSREATYLEALREGFAEEMRRDPMVFVMGIAVGAAGGSFKAFEGLYEEFGPNRVVDTPISEEGFTGLGVGAAMTGMRPVIDIMFGDFVTVAMDPIVNQAAKMYYMTGGQAPVPIVIHTTLGAGRRQGAQHSQCLHAWFAHIPGLQVVAPSTPADAKGLMKSAIRYDGPVVFFDHKMTGRARGPIPEGEHLVPLGVADVKREGTDVTVVAISKMVDLTLEAADLLAGEGISVEVVDPRTISPLDTETIAASVRKTHRAMVVDEGHLSFGVSGEIASRITERAFDYLDGPVERYCSMDVPVPFTPSLEDAVTPTLEGLVARVRRLVLGA